MNRLNISSVHVFVARSGSVFDIKPNIYIIIIYIAIFT